MWWCHLQRWCGLVLLLIAPVALVSAASLFTAETMADGTLYSDSVARRQGDLITIMVQENTSVSEKNKTTAKRNNKLSAAVNVIPFSSETPQVSGASSAGRLPAVAAESAKNFQGQGDYEATGEVKATIDTTELKQVKAPPKGIALGGGRPAYVAIPGKYTKPETANLSAEVKNGPREWNIELAD